MIPPRDNPFRVDRVSALPYLPDPQQPEASPERLADRLLAIRQAALVGPHGAGKSTALRAVAEVLTGRGVPALHVGLPGSASRAERAELLQRLTTVAGTFPLGEPVVLLDGFEQLPGPKRRILLARYPRLLVTAHRAASWPSRLPVLLTLQPTPATLDRVLAALIDPVPPAVKHAAHAAFARHDGNVRETLFDLYDQWSTLANSQTSVS